MNEPARNAIVQAVTAEPSVAAMAASWPDAGGPGRRSRKPTAPKQRSHTSSYRRNTSACSISQSCAGGRSRRLSARLIIRWPSFPKRPRARSGRMPMLSARSLRLDPDLPSDTRPCRRAAARVANVHGGRGRPRRGRVPDRTLQEGRRLRAGECRDGQDVAHRTRSWRSRTGTASAPQSIDHHRSQHGPPGVDHADAGQDGHLLPPDRVLVDGRPRRRSRWR